MGDAILQLKFDFSFRFVLISCAVASSSFVCFQLPNGNNWHNWHILQKLNKNPMRNNGAAAATTTTTMMAAATTTQRRSKRRRRNNGACHKCCCCCCCKKNTDWQKKTIEDRRLRITMEKWKNLSANNTQRTAVVLQQQRLATTTTTTSSSAKTAVAASACRLAQACNKMLLICVGKTQNARSIGNWISPFAGADDPGAGSDRFASLRFGLIKEPFFLCAAKKN